MDRTQGPGHGGDEWSFACHLTAGERGSLAVVRRTRGKISVSEVAGAPASGLDEPRRPVLIGLDDADKVLIMDPTSKQVSRVSALPVDAVPAYAYLDTAAGLYWMVNDGDKDTGVDTVQCGGGGSPITAVQADAAAGARILKTLCIGRGHHVTIFTAPSPRAPAVPRRIFSSNLLDGTLTVIGNDPADTKTYLNVIDVINLCDAAREDGKRDAVPNNAFPHGMAYSPLTGKVYNMNNGYGTVAVIDPVTLNIEATVGMKTSSNLLLSPDGRFLIGKGADRKADPEHVIGRLSVMDGAGNTLVKVVDLPDVYPSVYRFSADGRRLYVTTAATGKGVQKERLKLDTLLVFDSSALPELRLIKEVKVGRADCGRRPIAFITGDRGGWTFVPNPSDGTLSILDGASDSVVETVTLGPANLTEINFSFWKGLSYGA
jgi:DNA-binding beta-propeller fold protein YncE